jgi:hypothetical protein
MSHAEAASAAILPGARPDHGAGTVARLAIGQDAAHVWTSLALLGVGWNFGCVGASSLSLNDFIVFGTMACVSFASGGLLTAHGWDTVLQVSFAPLALAIAALAIGAAARGRAARAA